MDLAALARRQGGVFTRAQARASGLSDDQIDRRLRSGRWCPALRGPVGVLMEAATPLAPLGQVWGCVLAAGPGAVLYRDTGAWLWGWCAARPHVQLAVAADRRPRVPVPGRLHRVALPADDVRVVAGLPVTSPVRTLADCIRLLPRADASAILDRAQQRQGPPLHLVAAALPPGGRGCAQARRLLAAADGALFAAERRAAALLRRARITGWSANVPLVLYGVAMVLDFAFPALKIAIEVDGFAHHHAPDRFQRDRHKQNALVRAGWLVLRFTWADLVDRPDQVIAQIRAAIALRVDG